MRSTYHLLGLLIGVSASLVAPSRASAAEAGFSLQASGSGVNAQGSSSGGADDFWRQYRPTPMALELGIYGGLALFSAQHNLQNLAIVDESPAIGHQKLNTALDLGLRAGFYPLSFLGAEGEVGVIPSKTDVSGDAATIWTYRLSAVAQYPEYRLVPFVLVGAGGMNLRSDRSGLGKDSDPALHFGVGAKFAVTQYISARFDFRDNLMQENRLNPSVDDGNLVQNFELLLGASFTLGRTPAQRAAAPVDSDNDGFYDPQDACPMQPGVAPNGCPAPVAPVDTDKDGIPDPSDPCPTEAEDGAQPNPTDGCPNKDADGDGVLLPDDKCPDIKGVAPDGCIHDKDGDGIVDEVDKCPDQPETKNGFQDADGCPDELPKEVAKFSGVIKGIQFDFGKATIRAQSNQLLDEAVKVLQQYPDLRISVSGHTDNVGEPAKNLELSQARADAVKTYFTAKGIDATRIETRGAGETEPVADNATDAGRQQNRRIEFKLLQQK
ncbi:MAG: OmpA/MotB domain protein [Polyangiaceae bacterium]|nr:OmpA/MotB domain protein [Polyangiaceae bacterium]